MPEPVRRFFTVKEGNTFKLVQWKNGYMQFTVRAWNIGLQIGIFNQIDQNEVSNQTRPTYTFKIGFEPWIDSKVTLHKDQIPQTLCSASVPHILDPKEWRGFWLHISKGTISFGRENECEPIISFKDSDMTLSLTKVGFSVQPHLYGHYDLHGRTGEADIVVDLPTKSQASGVRWAKCSGGEKPENPFVGGQDSDGNPMYVMRTLMQGALTPGKLVNGLTYGEISWNCKSHRINQYEVLADFEGDWVKAKEDKIPPLAIVAGRSEINHPLYIGRVSHAGTVTVGKVHASHKVLYIPFANEELAFKEYEILCHKPPGPSVIPHPMPDIDHRQEELKWVYSCTGRMPRNSFVIGSHNDQAVILIRTKYEGIWFPGWVSCGDGPKGHVAVSRSTMNIEEYEVLCDFSGYWEKPNDLTLPENALMIDTDPQESGIYVGRAWHRGSLLCGQVIDGSCEICYGNDTIEKEEFEVLCHPNFVASATKNGLNNRRQSELFSIV